MGRIVLSWFVLGVITRLDAAKILAVTPTPSISHQFVFRPITQELARRGHAVTVITPDPVFAKGQSPPNLTEIDVHDISYTTWDIELKKVAVGSDSDIHAQLNMFLHLFNFIFEKQLQTKEVHDLIKKEHFDLILAEACVRPTLVLSHIFKAPVIQVSSFGAMIGTNKVVGAPNHPLYQPLVVRQRLYNLTWWEKIRETYNQLKLEDVFYSHEPAENSMIKRVFGPNVPTLSELYDNVELVLLNVHPIWSDNQPVPPGLVYMGGIHQNPAKELPEDLELYLNSSKHGVIYMSFGTNVQPSILPPQKIRIMMKVFSELPYNVVWKWDTDLPDKPSNIRVIKWLPQSDLLRHPNLKLFITQGGLQSTDEAITAGVPLIGVPVIADQWFNTEKYVRHGIGKKLDIGTFTEEEFKTAIVTVIEDPSYRSNVIRLRTLMNDEPQKPLERAIWWIEHVLRHGGGRHLRATAANLSFTEYYEINLILYLLAGLILVLIVVCIGLYYLQKFVLNHVLPFRKLKIL